MNDALDKAGWVHRCVAHLVTLDPSLDPDLARPIAEDMYNRPRWRDMGPEPAAQTVFDVGSRWGADDV